MNTAYFLLYSSQKWGRLWNFHPLWREQLWAARIFQSEWSEFWRWMFEPIFTCTCTIIIFFTQSFLVHIDDFPNSVLLRVASICCPVSSKQLIHGDHQPANPAADLYGEKLLAAEKNWGPGRGEGLPPLPAGPLHLFHKEPWTGAEPEPVQ